jgi:uncharacterized protein (DUF302 family)
MLMDKMMDAMMCSMDPNDKQDTMLKMMPAMIKRIKGAEIMNMFQQIFAGMMFVTHESKFNFTDTIRKIMEGADEYGWYNPTINNHYDIEKDLGLDNPNKVATVSMCIPREAHKILKVDKKLAVMMPMQINVFEEDDKTYITWMNIKLMGKMYGNEVAGIMGEACHMLMEVHKGIIKQEEE